MISVDAANNKIKESEKLKSFMDELIALLRKYDAEISGTDDFGLEITVQNEGVGGDFDTTFYRVTDEGIL